MEHAIDCQPRESSKVISDAHVNLIVWLIPLKDLHPTSLTHKAQLVQGRLQWLLTHFDYFTQCQRGKLGIKLSD